MGYWTRFIKWCQRPDMIKIHMFNPGPSRLDLFRGAKFGVVSGAIYGSVNSPIMNLGCWAINWLRSRQSNLPYNSFENWVASTMQPWLLGSIVLNTISGVITGLIFGLIFVALYDKLPGKTPMIKGIVISLILWATLPLGLPVVFNLYRYGFEGLYWLVYTTGYLNQAMIGLGASILWGWLLGRFWTRERGKR